MIKLSTISTYASVSRSRLQSLYSDFSPQKHSNPAGFQSNVDWWRRTLFQILSTAAQPSSLDVLILHADTELLDGLRYEEFGVGKPLGIGSVIAELSSSGAFLSLSSFQSSANSIYYSRSLAASVASYLVSKPLWWALSQLNLVGDDGEQRETEEKRWRRVRGDYVVIPLLEQAADTVLEYYRSQPHFSLSDSLRNMETFRAEFASKALPGVTLSLSDIKVLIKYLERDRHSIITDREVIKFIDPESDDKSAHVVMQVDHGVLEMKVAVTKLQEQIEEIQRKIEDRAAMITEQLRRKQREMALSYLRSRKQLEGLLVKRLRSLETIQSTLLQVESAAGDIQIMKAYEMSTMTLKTLLSHPSLQREKIDETMDAMADASADYAEIEQAIKLGGDGVTSAGGIGVDDEELQRELQELVDDKEREEAEARELEALDNARKERRQKEMEERQGPEREGDKQTRHDEEDRQRKVLPESGRRTPESDEAERQWQQRWTAAQADKAAQAYRDKEAEQKRRAKWDIAQINNS